MTIYNAPNTYKDDEVKIWNILIYNDLKKKNFMLFKVAKQIIN